MCNVRITKKSTQPLLRPGWRQVAVHVYALPSTALRWFLKKDYDKFYSVLENKEYLSLVWTYLKRCNNIKHNKIVFWCLTYIYLCLWLLVALHRMNFARSFGTHDHLKLGEVGWWCLQLLFPLQPATNLSFFHTIYCNCLKYPGWHFLKGKICQTFSWTVVLYVENIFCLSWDLYLSWTERLTDIKLG